METRVRIPLGLLLLTCSDAPANRSRCPESAVCLRLSDPWAQAFEVIKTVDERMQDCNEEDRAHYVSFRNAAWSVAVLASALEEMGAHVVRQQQQGALVIGPRRREVIRDRETGVITAIQDV